MLAHWRECQIRHVRRPTSFWDLALRDELLGFVDRSVVIRRRCIEKEHTSRRCRDTIDGAGANAGEASRMSKETSNPYMPPDLASSSLDSQAPHPHDSRRASGSRWRIVPCALLLLYALMQALLHYYGSIDRFFVHRANPAVRFYPLQVVGSLVILVSTFLALVIAYRVLRNRKWRMCALATLVVHVCGYYLLLLGAIGPTVAYSTVWRAVLAPFLELV